MITDNDIKFMRIALEEAKKSFEKNEVPVGAIVVCNNEIIGRGHNLTQTLNDVTAHAEMQSITAASNYIGGKYLNQCTLYVTLEPCVMCAGAMFWAQLGRLVYGASDTERGFTTVKHALLHPVTTNDKGVLEEECSKLIKKFFQKKRYIDNL